MHRRKPRIPYAQALLLTLPTASALLLHAAFAAPPAHKPTPKPKAKIAPSSVSGDAFPKDVLPLVKTYCVPCHQGESPSGGLALNKDGTMSEALLHRDMWERVIANIQSKRMPPSGMPAPTLEQRTKLITALQAAFSHATCDVKEPGRVTARRLNRAEYTNTIHDLTGVDVPGLTDDFPSDEVGYGFDNIGDVLSLSPLLLEKYLTAAGKVARAAITAPENRASRLAGMSVTGDKMSGAGTEYGASARLLYTNGQIGFVYDFPATGTYTLRAVAWEMPAGPEYAKMSFSLGDHVIREVSVPARERKPGTYAIPIEITHPGKQMVAVAFLNDYYNADSTDPKIKGDRNLVVESLEVRPTENVTPVAVPPTDSERRLMPIRPQANTEAAKDFATRKDITPFLLRAYRRPPTATEVDRLVKLAGRVRAQGGSFERGMQVAIQAALVSPNFLFRIERDPATAGLKGANKERPLNGYELATRLSYFLWSSTPDDRLLTLAGQGKLQKPVVLEAEAQRMLHDPRAAQTLGDNFAAQWLQLRKLDRVTPDTKQFPEWNPTLRDAMRNETMLYFKNIVTGDRNVLEFLDSDYTYLNEPLARLYGNTTVTGSDFRKVHLEGGERGGVLTQASVLTVTSNPTRTSPVKRGKWVLENLLGETIPPPPPGVPQLPDDAKKVALTGTLRQRMEQHRSNPACASCHTRMDPIGFGLENYNAIGMWRKLDDGHAIDASGALTDGRKFEGASGLRTILKGMSPKFVHNLSEKMLTYALGRGVESYDRCSVDDIAAGAAKKGYRFSAIVTGIVASEPFRYRHADSLPKAPPVAENGSHPSAKDANTHLAKL